MRWTPGLPRTCRMALTLKNFRPVGFDTTLDAIHVGANGQVSEKADADAKVIDCNGAFLSPGWCDLHVHVWHGGTDISIRASEAGRNTGVTAMADAGSAGEASFHGLREYVIEPHTETIRAFLNIGSIGLVACNRVSELIDARSIDIDRTFEVIEANRDNIARSLSAAQRAKADRLVAERRRQAEALSRGPTPAPAAAPPAAFRVQLGAFLTAENAPAVWRRLRVAQPDLLGGLRQRVQRVRGKKGARVAKLGEQIMKKACSLVNVRIRAAGEFEKRCPVQSTTTTDKTGITATTHARDCTLEDQQRFAQTDRAARVQIEAKRRQFAAPAANALDLGNDFHELYGEFLEEVMERECWEGSE